MPTTINCPTCGAPLEAKPGDRMIRCKFCGNEVAVPEAAAAAPLMASLPASMDMQKILQLKAVKELARQGKQDEAARIYREVTGATEEEARSAIEAISAGQPVVLASTNVTQRILDGNSNDLMIDIENMLRSQSDPQVKAVGDMLWDASHQGQAVQPETASMPIAPSSPSPAGLPAEPVIVNPMDAPASGSGRRGLAIGCAVMAVLVLIAMAGAVAFFLARSAFQSW